MSFTTRKLIYCWKIESNIATALNFHHIVWAGFIIIFNFRKKLSICLHFESNVRLIICFPWTNVVSLVSTENW